MKEKTKKAHKNVNSGGGIAYFLGLIGALVYFIQQAGNFWEGVIGVLKAMVWPAFVVYQLLEFLQM